MRKTKKSEPKTQTRAIHLYEGMSLADLLKQVVADGITDLSTVKYDHDYEGCCGGHPEGEYCYCSPSYSEMRFCYQVKA
jgi:hypothetical protein